MGRVQGLIPPRWMYLGIDLEALGYYAILFIWQALRNLEWCLTLRRRFLSFIFLLKTSVMLTLDRHPASVCSPSSTSMMALSSVSARLPSSVSGIISGLLGMEVV